MTAGKQPSPMAKALSKVSGAMKGPEPERDAGSMAAAYATAPQVAVPTAAAAAAAAPPAPAPAPAATQAGTAYGSPGAAGPAGGPSTAPATAAKKPSAPRPSAPPPTPGRRVRLTVARVDPWSVMKISFLVSVAIGIALVVMVAVLWLILDGMGVFSSLNRTIADIQGTSNDFNLMDYIALPRVMSLSVVVGVIDVILLTALSTLGAFLYNVCSSLVGGVQLTLSDD